MRGRGVASTDLWTVKADPAQFGTALPKRAINARDAMPSGGRPTPTAHNVTLVLGTTVTLHRRRAGR